MARESGYGRSVSGNLTLADVLDDAALLSFEHQMHLSEVLGEHSFNVNLAERRFEFRCAERTLVCTGMHMLGSAAPGPQSWLWSWANPTGYPAEVVAVAKAVQEFGAHHGITELAAAEVPFGAFGDDLEPHQVSWTMMELAKPISGHWTSYQGNVGNGTFVAFLVEHPELRLPPPSGPRLLRVLSQGVAELALTDHRRAVHSYLTRRGLAVAFAPNGESLRFDSPAVNGTVDFDEYGRMAGINGGMSA
ncbi:hypothetical protein GL305_00735 [Nocardia seriolae]|nr:hypothetical protein [Nocardia seriolae]MTJ72247.1 hypothetical protein [Nocardia seriolae]MTJ84594.1 hypothetical protein [Nocardia seriolae]MTK28582.1 hypothetical protein [Nocardia seriolae]MTK38505.1 hypothetical protein [Nocardia seriolae]